MIGATARNLEGLPGTLFWAYQDALNRQADILFWHETHYKPNQRLNPADPRDRARIPQWWAARARVEQGFSPKGLLRERAIEKVFDMHRGDPLPVFVHSAGAGGSETVSFPALGGKREEDYVRARMRDASYVAIFNANDPKWPQPIFEAYPGNEIEIARPPTNVSGDAGRGSYGNKRSVDRSAGSAGIPGALFWAYQEALNRQTDALFWRESSKPILKLNPADPHDRALIPHWRAARARIKRRMSPRELIRAGALDNVIEKSLENPSSASPPVFVYSAGASGSQTVTFPTLGGQEEENYVRARLRDSSYVAIFNTADPRWPQPIYESYPGGEIEIEAPSPPSPAVSGDAAPKVIHYEGLTLRPLAPEDAADQFVALSQAPGGGWIDFEGRHRRGPRLLDVYRPGDVLYYWDGPWGVLAGSRGIAVVRNGAVVEAFTTVVS